MAGGRGTVFVFVMVIVVIIAGSALLIMTQPAPAQITILPPQPTGTPAPLNVYVTGAVQNPGAVRSLPAGSLAQDAIAAAGGAAESADLTRINLARRLFDGDQVHVPEISSEPVTSASDPAGDTNTLTDGDIPDIPNSEGIINGIVYLNRANAEELQQLPGIGPAMSERILAYRMQNGRISSFEDLDQIQGVGQGLIGDLQGLVAFD